MLCWMTQSLLTMQPTCWLTHVLYTHLLSMCWVIHILGDTCDRQLHEEGSPAAHVRVEVTHVVLVTVKLLVGTRHPVVI